MAAERGFVEHVVVPQVVGLSVGAADIQAVTVGLSLAVDPDGPPLQMLTGSGEYLVTSQLPAPGSRRLKWDLVRVTWEPVGDGGEAGVREPRRPRTPLEPIRVRLALPGPGED